MAENFKLLALKKVKLEDADEAAVRGYKGEIDLLQKLRNVDRVVRLYDWEMDEQRQVLSLVCLALSIVSACPNIWGAALIFFLFRRHLAGKADIC